MRRFLPLIALFASFAVLAWLPAQIVPARVSASTPPGTIVLALTATLQPGSYLPLVVGEPPTPTPPPNDCVLTPDPGSVPNYPIRIVGVDKAGETVTLENVSSSAIDLAGWQMCSVTGNQHHPISGTLQPGETRIFPGPTPAIWNNTSRDDGALYAPDGRLISYWVDA